MVEHDVEPHLDVVLVGGGDERGQLAGGVVPGRVLAVDGAEGQRHVAPVAALLRIVLVHRQQLDDRDPERGQPGQLARRAPAYVPGRPVPRRPLVSPRTWAS